MKNKTTTGLECTHCHQPVSGVVMGSDNRKIYCCYGCKVVDELLSEKPHILPGQDLEKDKYNYLDESGIRASLLDFEDNKHVRLTLHLPAIHCSSCIYLLESLPEIEDAIMNVQVHFSKKEAVIDFNNSIALSHLAALLDYIGYPPDFQTKLGREGKKKNILLIQLGVAGFFFGNTMLLALPEYFNSGLSADPRLQQFFRYLMMAFSIPVMSFSARDYFINAWKSMRAGIPGIDLPIALGICTLFIQSLYEVITASGAGYFDSLTGLVFFLLIGKWYQQKTYQNFSFDRDFKSFIPLAANLISENDEEKPVAVADLQKEDIIRIRQGEVLPADAILLSKTAQVDYSYITGESLPIAKRTGESVFAGARIKGKSARFQIRASVNQSYLSSLWNHSSFKNSDHKKSRSLIDSVAIFFTPILLLIAISGAIAWSFYDVSKAISVFTAVLIVACPCALALAEPFASGSMMRWFGRYGFYLKDSKVLNRLSSVDHLVFDKTGTLTRQDNIVVQWKGHPLQVIDKVRIGAIAKNAQHGLAQPLIRFLNLEKENTDPITEFREEPGEGVTVLIDKDYYRLGKADYVGTIDHSESTSIYVEKNGEVLGYFTFQQQLRQKTTLIIGSLIKNYRISLLSGDNEAEKKRFTKILGPETNLLFNQSPHQKLKYLGQIQQEGAKVLMIGDGLNDAGALQQSEVGVSLCEKNINFFPASDALLMSESFGNLDKFIELSRHNKRVIHRAFVLSFIYNLAGLSFALAGVLSPLVCAILMPLSSVSVVLFTTFSNAYACKRKLQR